MFACVTTSIDHPCCHQHMMSHLVYTSYIHAFPEDNMIICFFQSSFELHFSKQEKIYEFCVDFNFLPKIARIISYPYKKCGKFFLPLQIFRKIFGTPTPYTFHSAHTHGIKNEWSLTSIVHSV